MCIPIRPEAGLTHAPVIELFVIGMKLRAPGEGLSIYTVVKTLAVASAVPEIGKALIEISAAGGHQRSMGLLGSFGDDIDDTVDSICSPDGAARASNDFDPFDILKQCVLDLPIDAGEQRRVNAPTVCSRIPAYRGTTYWSRPVRLQHQAPGGGPPGCLSRRTAGCPLG